MNSPVARTKTPLDPESLSVVLFRSFSEKYSDGFGVDFMSSPHSLLLSDALEKALLGRALLRSNPGAAKKIHIEHDYQRSEIKSALRKICNEKPGPAVLDAATEDALKMVDKKLTKIGIPESKIILARG